MTNIARSVRITPINMEISTAWQQCNIYIQLQIFETRQLQYADKHKCVFIVQRLKLNEANGEEYSLMWTKVEFFSVW